MQFVLKKVHKVLIQDNRTLVKNAKWRLLVQKDTFSKIFTNNCKNKLTNETKTVVFIKILARLLEKILFPSKLRLFYDFSTCSFCDFLRPSNFGVHLTTSILETTKLF
jgi:hypothetical protein